MAVSLAPSNVGLDSNTGSLEAQETRLFSPIISCDSHKSDVIRLSLLTRALTFLAKLLPKPKQRNP